MTKNVGKCHLSPKGVFISFHISIAMFAIFGTDSGVAGNEKKVSTVSFSESPRSNSTIKSYIFSAGKTSRL